MPPGIGEHSEQCAYARLLRRLRFRLRKRLLSPPSMNNSPVCGDFGFPRILSLLVAIVMTSSPSSPYDQALAQGSPSPSICASRWSRQMLGACVCRAVSSIPLLASRMSFRRLRKGMIRQSWLAVPKYTVRRMRLCLSRGSTCLLTASGTMKLTRMNRRMVRITWSKLHRLHRAACGGKMALKRFPNSKLGYPLCAVRGSTQHPLMISASESPNQCNPDARTPVRRATVQGVSLAG